MGAQHQRTRLLRLKLGHDARPEKARGAQLGRFHEEIHADGEEEGEPPGKLIDIQALCERCAHIFAAIGQREGKLLRERRAGFLHVVAGDRDGVEARHFPGRIGDDVGDDPHRRFRRIDIGVADHELLEDIVLDRAGQFGPRTALLFARHDEIGEDRNDRAIHRHGDRHVLQRDAIEQDLHVLDAVYGDTRLANIAFDTRMIAVIAAMGGEIEGDRQTFLASGQIAAIEGIAFLGRRKARILADCPGAAGIHGGARTAREGGETRQAIEVIHAFQIGGRIERLDVDPLRRMPDERLRRCLQLLFGKRLPVCNGFLGHRPYPPGAAAMIGAAVRLTKLLLSSILDLLFTGALSHDRKSICFHFRPAGRLCPQACGGRSLFECKRRGAAGLRASARTDRDEGSGTGGAAGFD